MVNPHTEPQEEKAEIEHVDHSTDVVQDDALYEGAPEPTLTLKVYLAMSVSALTRDALHAAHALSNSLSNVLCDVITGHCRAQLCSALLVRVANTGNDGLATMTDWLTFRMCHIVFWD